MSRIKPTEGVSSAHRLRTLKIIEGFLGGPTFDFAGLNCNIVARVKQNHGR